MTVFEDELTRLNGMVLAMGELVKEQINDSVRALVERETKLATKVVETEPQVDALDVELDEECIRLIARYQPVAADLRLITTAMKITTDLERMGDQAANIAKKAIDLNKEEILKPYIDIPQMSNVAQGMTRDALEAFVRRDKTLAVAVMAMDSKVDHLRDQVLNELSFYIAKDPSMAPRVLKIGFITQSLERIADHATNIAEMVIYLVEGRIVRHQAVPEE